MQFGSNFSLGAISAVYAAVSIISLLLLKRFTTVSNRKPVFITFTSLIVLAGLLFILLPNKATLITLNVVIALTAILQADLLEKYRFSILKSAGLYNQIAEHQTCIENRFNISRTLSFVLLLLVSLIRNSTILSIFVISVLTILSSVQILLLFFERKYAKEEPKQEPVEEKKE